MLRPLLFLAAFGCAASAPPPPAGSAADPVSAAPAPSTTALSWITRAPLTADREAAMVVLLHGLGDRPEAFQRLLDGWDPQTRVITLQPPLTHGDGWAWFPPIPPGPEGAGPIGDAADRVAVTLGELTRRFPTRGRPIVVGFSQGAAVAFALVARHPDRVAGAVPIAGWLPPALLPAALPSGANGAGPMVLSIHGDVDDRVPILLGIQAVSGLQRAGADAHLAPFPGVGHSIPPEARALLQTTLHELVAAQAR
jgi:phospholipase/carboxylesterase